MGRSNLLFSDVNQLIRFQENRHFARMLHLIACLKTVAYLSDSQDIAQLMHFMNGKDHAKTKEDELFFFRKKGEELENMNFSQNTSSTKRFSFLQKLAIWAKRASFCSQRSVKKD